MRAALAKFKDIPEPPVLEDCTLWDAVVWLAYDLKPISIEYYDAVNRPLVMPDTKQTQSAQKDIFGNLKAGVLEAYGVKPRALQNISAQSQLTSAIQAADEMIEDECIDVAVAIPADFWNFNSIDWRRGACWKNRIIKIEVDKPFYTPLSEIGKGKHPPEQDGAPTVKVKKPVSRAETIYTNVFIKTEALADLLREPEPPRPPIDIENLPPSFANIPNLDPRLDERRESSVHDEIGSGAEFPLRETPIEHAKVKKVGRRSAATQILEKYHELKQSGKLLVPKNAPIKVCSLSAAVDIIMPWAMEMYDDAPTTKRGYENILRGAHNEFKAEFAKKPTQKSRNNTKKPPNKNTKKLN